jgi:hypothetical protein
MIPPSGEDHHFMVIKSGDLDGVRELFDVSFGHLNRRKKTVTVSLLKGQH